MKMLRLNDTNVVDRLKAYQRKHATMTDRLQAELDAFNPGPLYHEDGSLIPRSGEGGPGKFIVTEHPFGKSLGKEIAIVRDEIGTDELLVEPFTAIYHLQHSLNPQRGPAVSAEDVWDALYLASEELYNEMPQDSLDEGGATLNAATLHAEDRIQLDALIAESCSGRRDAEIEKISEPFADILVRVSMENAIPSHYSNVDYDASRTALLKAVQGQVLAQYPAAFVDVTEGARDGRSVRTQNAKMASKIKEAVDDIICETRRDASTWIVFEENSL